MKIPTKSQYKDFPLIIDSLSNLLDYKILDSLDNFENFYVILEEIIENLLGTSSENCYQTCFLKEKSLEFLIKSQLELNKFKVNIKNPAFFCFLPRLLEHFSERVRALAWNLILISDNSEITNFLWEKTLTNVCENKENSHILAICFSFLCKMIDRKEIFSKDYILKSLSNKGIFSWVLSTLQNVSKSGKYLWLANLLGFFF